MTDMDSDQILAEITALADQAGEKIMGIYRTDFSVRKKDDASPVTEADEVAEKLIVAGLRELTPEIPVVAEEEMAAGAEIDVSGGIFWLVDPLDGTREFVNKRDEFTVNIALVKDTVPVLGVVGAPAVGTLYAGALDGDAIIRRDGKFTKISARKQPERKAVIIASRSHGDKDAVQKLLDDMPEAEMKMAGSSLKFCLVAEGAADIYPRYGHTREWDTAAGDAVLRAAGGSVRTLDGAPMLYGKEHFLNDEFIARGLD